MRCWSWKDGTLGIISFYLLTLWKGKMESGCSELTSLSGDRARGEARALDPSLVLFLPQCVWLLFSGPVPGKGIGSPAGCVIHIVRNKPCPFCDFGFESNNEITKGNESFSIELFLKWALLFLGWACFNYFISVLCFFAIQKQHLTPGQ